MDKLTAPYNFVPLNRHVYVPDWAEQVSHDIPFEDGEDGWIEVTWKNVSPLIVRDGSLKGTEHEGYSTYVTDKNGKKRYFIPGTSIKGMLRSVLEVLSYGKMSQYDNRFFGYRELGKNKSGGKKNTENSKLVKWGWLKKEDKGYVLLPCTKECEKISLLEVSKYEKKYNSKKTQWERNLSVAKGKKENMFPTIERNGEKYRLYCTGKMGNKKHEILIPAGDESRKISLDKVTVEKFKTIHATTPGFQNFDDMLDEGYSIPVSYISGNNGRDGIEAIGLSKLMRNPYKHDVKTLIENEQPARDAHDLCETIFGWISDNGSMRGRVQIGSAFCTREVSDDELLKDEGVLGEPKPSYYPLYLKQEDKNKFKTYDNASGIAGRKFYRIHKDGSTIDLPKGKDDVMTMFKPLKAGLTFRMRINVHNLRKFEIGALLSAITLHKTEGVYHNIGGAKSFGYGKIKCEIDEIKLNRLKYEEVDEYLQDFEREMPSWANPEHVNTLISILSEHKDESEMKMMSLEDYKTGKDNGLFKKFKNNGSETSMLREDKEKKVNSLLNGGGANNQLKKQEPERKQEQEQKQASDKKAKNDAKARDNFMQKLENGLKSTLEEKQKGGNGYVIVRGRACNKKVNDWIDNCKRFDSRDKLNDQEVNDYCYTLKRLMQNKREDEREAWSSFGSELWRTISGFIGEEKARQLFEEG